MYSSKVDAGTRVRYYYTAFLATSLAWIDLLRHGLKGAVVWEKIEHGRKGS